MRLLNVKHVSLRVCAFEYPKYAVANPFLEKCAVTRSQFSVFSYTAHFLGFGLVVVARTISMAVIFLDLP